MANRRLVDVDADVSIVDGLPVLAINRLQALIIADVHLGYESALAATGVFLPRIQLRSALRHLSEALESVPWRARLIIDGDLKHTFEKLTRQERVEIARLGRWLSTDSRVKEVIVIRGNHDTFVAPLLRDLGVELVEGCLELGGGLVAAHGHQIVDCDFDTLIIGHEHPSLQVDVGGARVKLPVLLDVPIPGSEARVLVLPAFGAYQTGHAVSLDGEAYLSPIIRERGSVGDAEVWVVDREAGTMRLGPLKYVLPV
ncbi:MAG: metallophosphoesterase [Desulfurococcales archaeon]|nr:metallophosphoesterase [Desulfurococcales archaeon]